MNAMLLLMTLLALSYFGSTVVGRQRHGAATGLASGIEFVALGFILGPHALGVLGRDLLGIFEPLVQVAIGWLALVLGLDVASSRGLRPTLRGLLLGIGGSLLTMAAVAGAVWALFVVKGGLANGGPVGRLDRLLLAGGIGATCAESARSAVAAAAERTRARGPFTLLLRDCTRAQALIPLLGAATCFALSPSSTTRLALPFWGWTLVTVLLGMVLGMMASANFGEFLGRDRSWVILIGTSVLGIGLATRIGLASPTALFVMGVTVAAISRHGDQVRDLVLPVERPVLLPALVLAGARIDFHALHGLGAVVIAALAARVVAKIVFALFLQTGRTARRGGPILGLAFLPTGAVSVSAGLAFELRFPGPIGDAVLAVAAAACLLGEVIGPLSLRRVIEEAREQGAVSPSMLPIVDPSMLPPTPLPPKPRVLS